MKLKLGSGNIETDLRLVHIAREELRAAIESTDFHNPTCPVYQNISAKAVMDREKIKQNLIDQLTGPVLWTQTIRAMISDGAVNFIEVGPGKVLSGLVGKISKDVSVANVS